jgi:hypothetical protein
LNILKSKRKEIQEMFIRPLDNKAPEFINEALSAYRMKDYEQASEILIPN